LREFYSNSPALLVTSIFSSSFLPLAPSEKGNLFQENPFIGYDFLIWRFSKMPRGFFDQQENVLKYLRWLMVKVKVSNLEDLKIVHFTENGGTTLLLKYQSSRQNLFRAVREHFPRQEPADTKANIRGDGGEEGGGGESLKESEENSRKFEYKERHYWSSIENQRSFLDQYGASIGIKRGEGKKELEKWYNVLGTDLIKAGGGGLLKRYHFSLYGLLSAAYSEFEWLPWRFQVAPKSMLSDPLLLMKIFSHAEKDLKIERHQDWYRVSRNQLRELGAEALLRHKGGLIGVLRSVYPEEAWDEKFLLEGKGFKKASQRFLRVTLSDLFPNMEIKEDYYHPLLRSPEPFELDLYLPELGLGIPNFILYLFLFLYILLFFITSLQRSSTKERSTTSKWASTATSTCVFRGTSKNSLLARSLESLSVYPLPFSNHFLSFSCFSSDFAWLCLVGVGALLVGQGQTNTYWNHPRPPTRS